MMYPCAVHLKNEDILSIGTISLSPTNPGRMVFIGDMSVNELLLKSAGITLATATVVELAGLYYGAFDSWLNRAVVSFVVAAPIAGAFFVGCGGMGGVGEMKVRDVWASLFKPHTE